MRNSNILKKKKGGKACKPIILQKKKKWEKEKFESSETSEPTGAMPILLSGTLF